MYILLAFPEDDVTAETETVGANMSGSDEEHGEFILMNLKRWPYLLTLMMPIWP